jgi:hypothetical protein
MWSNEHFKSPTHAPRPLLPQVPLCSARGAEMFRHPPPRPTEAQCRSEKFTLIRGLLEEVRGLPELESHRRWAKLFQIPREVGSDLLGCQHRRHAVVDGSQNLVGLGGDHREALSTLLVLLPDARDPKPLVAGPLEPERDLTRRAVRPLVEGRGRDQASSLPEGLAPRPALQLVLPAVHDGSPELLGLAAWHRAAEAPRHRPQLAVRHQHGRRKGRSDDRDADQRQQFLHRADLDQVRKRAAAFAEFVGGAHGKN